ncbi:MAG: hypothetical protein LBQ89_05390 [Treponema sp.]|jgi:hypothetical protein|nr:hypothetical protein [Treponema sp.]
MKKAFFVSLIPLMIIMAVSCASSGGASGGTQAQVSNERRVNSRIPQFIRDALQNSPEDALVGIGTARMATQGQSLTVSATRARAELSRQMDIIVQDMVRDYTAGSEVDHSAVLSFQENITVTLSRSRLQGASVVNQDIDEGGNCWTVVMLSKGGVVQEINQAVAAAKLAVPAMASFNAEERMNQAFDRYYGTAEVGYSDKD